MLGLGLILSSRATMSVGLIGIAAVAVTALIAEERGASRERAACLAQEIAERDRQSAANEAAREAARAAARATIEAERRTAELLDEVTRVPTPSSPRCGLGADRVRGLDRLR